MNLQFPLILDGATGTELQKRGFTGEECAESWILKHPETIREIQRGYVAAGSRVLYAPTFGANRVKLAAHGLEERVREMNTALVALARESAGERAFIAGDLAPTGALLYPMGEMKMDELIAVYTEQAQALEDAGVDLFVIETMMSLAEARAALLAVKAVSDKPVFVSFTCDENGKTLTGGDVAAALVVLQAMGADAFGLNCSVGPEAMLGQLRRLKAVARVPLLCKPNAGVPKVVGGRTVYDCSPENFAACTEAMAAIGVQIFGGCCGTTAEHIAALGTATQGCLLAPPDPSEGDKLVCATEKRVFTLDPATPVGEALTFDDEIEDRLEELDDERAILTLRLQREEDIETLYEVQGLFDRPVCFACEDASLLEQALRAYQGRALYDGELSREVLAPLRERYGLIV